MLAAGVLPGTWHTDSYTLNGAPADARFVVGEVESSADYEGVVASLPSLDPAVPKAIITNLNGLVVKDPDGTTNVIASRERCAPIVDAGFNCQTEIYLSEAPNVYPEHLEFIAVNHCGFPSATPVFGIYGGRQLLDYQQWFHYPGHGAYLAEYL